MNKTTIALIAALFATTAQAADVKVVKGTKGLNRDYPAMQNVTLYMHGDMTGDSDTSTPAVFNGVNKDLIITQVCTYIGYAQVGGIDVVYDIVENDRAKQLCQTFSPGLTAPIGEPIRCQAYSCIITGWMRP
jgi:hypothetical protein